MLIKKTSTECLNETSLHQMMTQRIGRYGSYNQKEKLQFFLGLRAVKVPKKKEVTRDQIMHISVCISSRVSKRKSALQSSFVGEWSARTYASYASTALVHTHFNILQQAFDSSLPSSIECYGHHLIASILHQ